ncbi:MAG: polyphosphate--glucose phosphotransferase [Microthrixaceae bacterium]
MSDVVIPPLPLPDPALAFPRTRVGVDIGGTGIKGAAVDTVAGALTAERVRIPTPHPATPDAVARVVVDVLAEVGGDGPVGVTLPAVVRHGTALTAANIDEAWIGTDADALLTAATGRPCTVVNDADAAGVAEMRFGAGRGHDGVVLMLTLGTGIGSALFVDGVLVPNTEFGHLPLKGRDAEKYASELVREHEDLSWSKWAKRLTRYVALVEQLLWPDLIVIGGGVSKKADRFIPKIRSEVPIVAATLHNDAGIVGAALSVKG